MNLFLYQGKLVLPSEIMAHMDSVGFSTSEIAEFFDKNQPRGPDGRWSKGAGGKKSADAAIRHRMVSSGPPNKPAGPNGTATSATPGNGPQSAVGRGAGSEAAAGKDLKPGEAGSDNASTPAFDPEVARKTYEDAKKDLKHAMAIAKKNPPKNPGRVRQYFEGVASKLGEIGSTVAAGSADILNHTVNWGAPLALLTAIGNATLKPTDEHYKGLVKEYGATTANLIEASSYLSSFVVAAGAGVVGTSLVRSSTVSSVITSLVRGPASAKVRAAMQISLLGGAVGALGRYSDFMQKHIFRAPGELAAKIAFGKVGIKIGGLDIRSGMKSQGQKERDAEEHKTATARVEELSRQIKDLESQLEIKPSESAFAEFLDENEITLPLEEIHRLGEAYARIKYLELIEKLASKPQVWIRLANTWIKEGKITEDELLLHDPAHEGGDKKEAKMGYYLDGELCSYDTCRNAFLDAGFSATAVADQISRLEVGFFDESKINRGNQKNAGQFASKPGGAKKKDDKPVKGKEGSPESPDGKPADGQNPAGDASASVKKSADAAVQGKMGDPQTAAMVAAMNAEIENTKSKVLSSRDKSGVVAALKSGAGSVTAGLTQFLSQGLNIGTIPFDFGAVALLPAVKGKRGNAFHATWNIGAQDIGGGRPDAVEEKADESYGRLRKEYGATTANLIVAAGHLTRAAGVLGTAAAVGTMAPAILGVGLPAAAACAVLGSAGVGILGRMTNVGREITRWPAEMAAALSIRKVFRSKTLGDQERGLAKELEDKTNEVKAKFLSPQKPSVKPDAESKFSVLFWDDEDPDRTDKDEDITLPQEDIDRLGKVYAPILEQQYLQETLSNKEGWAKIAQQMLDAGVSQEELMSLLPQGGGQQDPNAPDADPEEEQANEEESTDPQDKPPEEEAVQEGTEEQNAPQESVVMPNKAEKPGIPVKQVSSKKPFPPKKNLAEMSFFFDGKPTPYAEVRFSLLSVGFSSSSVDDWISTLAVFYDPDQPRGQPGNAGQFAEKPGAKKKQDDAFAEDMRLANSFDGVSLALAKTMNHEIEKTTEKYLSEHQQHGIVVRYGGRVTAMLSNAANHIMEAATLPFDLAGIATMLKRKAVHHSVFADIEIGSSDYPKQQEISGESQQKLERLDPNYSRLRHDYGPTTANLISISGHLMRVGLGAALGVGVLAIAPYEAGALAALSGAAAFGGMSTAQAIATVFFTAQATGAVMRISDYGRAVTRGFGELIAKGAFLALGLKTGSQTEADRQKLSKDIAGIREAFSTVARGRGVSLPDEDHAKHSATFSDDRDTRITLPMEDILRLAKASSPLMHKRYVELMIDDPEPWKDLADQVIKSGMVTEKELLQYTPDKVWARLQKKTAAAEMSFFFDGRPTPYSTVRSSLLSVGFADSSVDNWISSLKPA